jgi:hypothetical protein
MRRSLVSLASVAVVLGAWMSPADAAAEAEKFERSGAAQHRRVPQQVGGTSRATAPNLSGNIAVFHPTPVGEGNIQNEPAVAVDPTDAGFIVAGSNDYRNGQGQSGWAVTTDGGDTWTDGTFDAPDVMPDPGGPNEVDSAGDPSIAFAPNGSKVYYGMLAFRADAFTGGLGGCEADSGIYVGSSTNGSSWTVVNAAPNGATVFNDKPMLTTDPVTGTIYLTYTRFNYGSANDCQNDLGTTTTPIMMRKSTDGGLTWTSNANEINVSGAPYPDSHGSQPIVAQDGSVFVVFESFSTTCPGGAPDDCIVVARSPDGGSSWGRSAVRELSNTGPYSSLPDATGAFRTNNFPSIGVAPNGRVMVVWGEKSSGSAEIFSSTSADGSGSWTSAQQVNQSSTGDQFFPWITFDAAGVAWVGYLDRRDDVDNNLYHEYVSHAHVGTDPPPYGWTDKQVSSAPSDPSLTHDFGGGVNHFIGDYDQIAARPGGGAFATWIDVRGAVAVGDQDIYGDTISVKTLNQDDNNGLWTYSSGWYVNEHSVYSSNSRHYTNAGGAYGEIVVDGGAWRYVATKGPNMGMADVYLDGTLYTRVDLYSPTTVQQVAATERPISPGPHTIRIQRSGFKNSASTSGAINIDALFISPTGVGNGVYQDTHGTAWGFTGTWATQASSAYSGGGRHWSNSRWSRANIVVQGSQVEFRSTVGPDMGIFAIWMDGVLIANANLYNPTTVNGTTVLRRSLTPGFHVFRLEVNGTRDSRSSSGQINFDVCVVT